MAALSAEKVNAEVTLEVVRESKVFLELTAIDLDVDSAFELAQIASTISLAHSLVGDVGK